MEDPIDDKYLKFCTWLIISFVLLEGFILGWLARGIWQDIKKQEEQPMSEYPRELLIVNGSFLKAVAPPCYIKPQILAVRYGPDSEEREWDEDTAYAVMMAESGGDPSRINWKDYHRAGNCWGSFGKWQLACFRGTREELLDPERSTEIAYDLWQREGWWPWTVYRNNQYLEFLP